MPTLKQLVARAKCLYPHSKHMRKQWVRRTVELETSGQHLARLGKWPYSGTQGRIAMRGTASTELAALIATTTTAVVLIGSLVGEHLTAFYTQLLSKIGA